VTVPPEKQEKWATLKLGIGSHTSFNRGACALEAAAWLAGEPHTDSPKCVDPFLTTIVRCWNDTVSGSFRDAIIKPLVPELIGTASDDPEARQRRIRSAFSLVTGVMLPTWVTTVNKSPRVLNAVEDMRRESSPDGIREGLADLMRVLRQEHGDRLCSDGQYGKTVFAFNKAYGQSGIYAVTAAINASHTYALLDLREVLSSAPAGSPRPWLSDDVRRICDSMRLAADRIVPLTCDFLRRACRDQAV